MFKKWWLKIILVFSVIGPAIIAGTANNDAGGISTYSYVGSRFGYLLLWVLTANFITLAVTQEIGMRLGVFTGKGLAALIREQFGVRWTFLAVIILLLANLAVATSEFAGIAAALELLNIPKWLTMPFFAVLVWLALYKGSFKKIEKLFLFLSLFFLVYVVSAVMSAPHWGEVFKAGLTPHFSLEPVYFFALLGVMGTTITPWGQFFIQAYVVDKGIGQKHYKIERAEVFVSAFFTCLIAAMIMVTTKNVLFDRGLVVDSAQKAALSLAPALGHWAEIIFAVGFFCASLLGAFILPLTTSYCICEALGFEHGIDRKLREAPFFYGLMAFIIVVAAGFVLNNSISPFRIMIFAQVLNGMLLPVILIFLAVLFSRREELGMPPDSRMARWFYKIVTWEAVARLSLVSILLVLFTIFPQLLAAIKRWWG